MNYDSILKHNGVYLTPSTQRPAIIGDIVQATGYFDTYGQRKESFSQRRLCTVVQQVTETRGDVIKVTGRAGDFECSHYSVLKPIKAEDVRRCEVILAESESFLLQGKRVSFGQNRGQSINTDFQRQAALNSIAEQRRILSEMKAQVG